MKIFRMKPVNFVSGTLNTLVVASVVMMGYMSIQTARAQEVARLASYQFENEVTHQLVNDDHSAEYQDYLVQLDCLARNIYFEARGEPDLGQRAVAWVTLNRVSADRYPDTICGVVHQARRDSQGNPIRHQCQFSWYCDGKSDRIRNQTDWREARLAAMIVIHRYNTGQQDPTHGATMYHADYVSPYWADDYVQTVQISTHIFYMDDDA
jgi:spore germination cell wall hydrolase CwlJ-like protein